MSKQEENENFRSKLYILQDEKAWEDQGTGYPMIAREDDKDILKFVLEDSNTIIYEMELTPEHEFERQDDQKVLTWFNPKDSLDMALSFQSIQGAGMLFKRLCEIVEQKRTVPVLFNTTSINCFTEESESEMLFEDFNLTVPTDDNLSKFENEILMYTHPYSDRKNTLCHVLCVKKIYIEALVKIFRQAEADKNEKRIDQIYKIFKILIQLSHFELYSVLLSDDYYMEVFGALEYDPEIKGKLKVSHRQYFRDHASFKQVANIRDEMILRTIHWNFRLIYLRDSVIAHVLDERVLQFLSAIIHSNYLDILRYIQSSREALVSMFEALRNRRLNALKMIHEICLTMKTLDIDRENMFDAFNEFGIFEILEEILQGKPQTTTTMLIKKKDPKKKDIVSEGELDLSKHTYLILEILMLSLVMAPHFLRDYCISQQQKITKYPFLTLICEKITSHEDVMTQHMLGEVIKHLIDTVEIGEDNPVTKLFYELFLGKIIKIFDDDSIDERVKNAKVVVIDLLMYCLKQQINMIKPHIVNLDVSNKLLKLFSTNDKFLILSSVQNFRMILHLHEEAILKSAIPFLDAMIAYFEKYCLNKNNAIHSAILEIFSIISKPEYEILIFHMVEKHLPFLELPEISKVADKIKERHILLTTGQKDPLEEFKNNVFDFAKRSRPNLTIISPFGSVLTQDNTKHKSLMSSSPSSNGNSVDMNSASGAKRTSSAMQMDYDDEMSFNMDTKGKDAGNFMIEDLHLKKRKSDEIHS